MNVQGHIVVSLERKGADGKDGVNGKDGENAVEYRITSSASNLVYFPARGTFSPDSLTVACVKIDGDTSDSYAAYWWVQAQYEEDGDFQTVATTTSASTSYTFQMSSLSQIPFAVRVSAHSATPTAGNQLTGCQETLYTSSQCALRVQNWEKVADGFAFECGKVGDTYLDVVIYGSTKSYYQCRTNHEKSDSTAPTSGGNDDRYWQLVNSFDNIATNVLLANYAKIENLYADDLFMDGTETAIWINPELDGMCVAKKGSSEPLNREDQEPNAGLWATPAVRFHGGTLPSVNDIYNGSLSGSITLAARTLYELDSSADYNVYDSTAYYYEDIEIGTIQAGQLMQFTIANVANAFSLLEGTSAAESLPHEYSSIDLRISISGIGTTTLKTWSMQSSSTPGETVYFDTGAVNVYATAAYTGTAILRLFRASVGAAPGTKIEMLQPITVSYSVVAQGYVSQFASDGMFVGTSSQDYFRMGFNAESSDENMQFTMLGGGTGFDITKTLALQYWQQTPLPIGGTLMAGYLVVSGTTLSTNIWTWDGNVPTMTYSTGSCVITFPSQWGNTLIGGNLTAGRYCVIVTPIANATRAYISSVGSNTVTIQTTGYNNTTLTSASFFIRIDYIAPTATNSLTLTGNGEEVILDESNKINNDKMLNK